MLAPPPQLDVDAHGRVTPRDDEARRALADRAGRFQLLPCAADLLIARRTPGAGGAAGRPRCVLAGDLAGFPLVDFVAFVHQSRLTGVLTVATGAAERSIAFRDGEVRSAGSNAPGERLGEVAVRLGFATEAQAAEAQASGQPIGRALVARGVLGPNDLWACVHEQVTAVFHALLLAREGIFLVLDQEVAEPPGSALAVSTQGLLMDGIRRIDEMSLFRARVPGPDAVVRRREPRRPVALNAAEQALLALVDERRTVAELAAAAHVNEFDATKTLFHLAEAGYVEAAGAGGPGGGAGIDALTEAASELLQHVTATVPADRRERFLADLRPLVGDAAALHAPIWRQLTVRGDGGIDRAALAGAVAALPPAALRRLEPGGDPARLALDALRELLFLYLFAARAHLTREEDDRLAVELKRRLAAIGGGAA